MALKDKIRVRRDTTANFTSTNPVLSLGEISFDTTTKQFKVGDGTSTWTALPYSDAAATASSISTALALYTPTSLLAAIATSGSASDLSGTLSKSQQHTQTAYKDEANTFSQAQTMQSGVLSGNSDLVLSAGTAWNDGRRVLIRNHNTSIASFQSSGIAFNASTVFVAGSWHKSSEEPAQQRFFFAQDGTTYIQGHGLTPIVLRNGAGSDLASFSSNGVAAFTSVTAKVNFETNVWHTSNADSINRVFFATNSITFFRSPAGHRFRNAATEEDTVVFSETGSATFNGSLKIGLKTIATLPSAASSSGERYQVSDSATIANRIAFSNGSAWYYEGTAVAV